MRKEFSKPEVEVIELGADVFTDNSATSGFRILKSNAESGIVITPVLAQELGELDYIDSPYYNGDEDFGDMTGFLHIK